jgi:hypothetical protein
MFKRLIASIARAVDEQQKQRAMLPLADAELRPSTAMDRMFGDCQPAVVAFKIDNGYVVRTIQHAEYERAASGFTYCKDHAAIADHIVSEAAREKVMPNYAQSSAKVGQVNTAPLPYPKR